jgi:hypothetical protein
MTTRSTRLVMPVEALEARIAPAAINLNLSDLVASKGFRISGIAELDYAGSSISGAGDINGDGFSDLIVGAPGSATNGNNSGTAYVVFGSDAGFGTNLNLAALDGTNGFTINGEAAEDQLGYSVSAAGDVNGDGIDDIAIGAPQAEPHGENSGAVYVIFGRAGGFSATLDLASLDGTTGFKIVGSEGELAGGAVSKAGDVNGDGFDDIILGAKSAVTNDVNAGAAYVVFGRASGGAPIVELSALDGAHGFKISGESAGDRAGASVSGAGDVNRDGFADVIIGAPDATANGVGSGAAYVVFGKGDGFGPDIAVSTLDGTTGFKINGEADGDSFGYSVSGGDVNGDSFGDLIIGAPAESEFKDYAGAAYVIFGKVTSFEPSIDASSLTGANGFKIVGEQAYDQLGHSVSNAGDVNGDGFDDVIAGAYYADANGSHSGAAYVIFGKPFGFQENVRLGSLDGSDGVQISGAHAGDYAGTSVCGLGDINGDGVDDLMIGAPYASPNNTYCGASYVIFGRGDPNHQNGSTVTVTDIDGDIVTIYFGGDWLTSADVTYAPDGSIDMIDLTSLASGAQHAIGSRILNLTIAVKTLAGGTGDGKVNVGFINAKGVALGKVQMQGNLGRIDAGDASGKSGIRSLAVNGDFGFSKGFPQFSHIHGGLNKLLVSGSMVGGAMQIDGILRSIAITGDFNGAPVGGQGALAEISRDGIESYAIQAGLTPAGVLLAEAIGKIKLGGSLKGGAIVSTKDFGTMTMGDFTAGGLFSGGKMHSIKVRGTMSTENEASPLSMTARNGIDTLVINGDVKNARILAGYTKDGDAVNPDARIGKVVVKGNWIQSSLVAGVEDSTGDGFGQNDTLIPGDTTPSIVSSIAKVIIKGTASGSPGGGDHFGIVAQQIGRVSIGGIPVNLQAGAADNILVDETNGDFRVVELGGV